MGEEQKCDCCDEPAEVFVSFVSNGKVNSAKYCSSHAANLEVEAAGGFGLLDSAKVSFSIPAAKKGGKFHCPECGFTKKDFERRGRMGCPACYRVFGELLSPILRQVHRGIVHQGKRPHRTVDPAELKNRLVHLQEALQKAVSEERYEDAASFRDELSSLRPAKDTQGKSGKPRSSSEN